MNKSSNDTRRFARYAETVLPKDASGWQTFKYGKLGEVTDVFRTFVLPYENGPYTFGMSFEYDSWNRIQNMTYPDGEVVGYMYNKGGMLNSMAGVKDTATYKYLSGIRYNRFGLKDTVYYGNGTWTEYEYDTLLRLERMKSFTSSNPGVSEFMQDIRYQYDHVGNITEISNSAGPLSNGLGNQYYGQYEYDNLYRMTASTGWWRSVYFTYGLDLDYHPNGRIEKKNMVAPVLTQTLFSIDLQPVHYERRYFYTNTSQPNTLTYINDMSQQQFEWDRKGNMTRHTNSNPIQDRRLCWDEQNRLLGVADGGYLSYYQYDANGERVYKLVGENALQNRNGEWRSVYYMNRPTLYSSPYLVSCERGYTKHYYAESERIASRIGGGGLNDIDMGDSLGLFASRQEQFRVFFDEVMTCLNVQAVMGISPLQFLYSWKQVVYPETDCYWYHPDHLGSSSWITYSDGKAVQHLHYLPWGEDFVRQRSTNWYAMYTFSAKEKDIETGYSYFGSRYYNSDLSIWLSVDPMSDKYPHQSNYVYCSNNPIRIIDPNGEDEWDLARDGTLTKRENGRTDIDVVYATNSKGETVSRSYKANTINQDPKDFSRTLHEGTEDAIPYTTDYMSFDNRETATDFFEFAAENTDV